MFEKIPPLITFDEEYLELALEKPDEFLVMESQEPFDSHNMRIFAGQLWIEILKHMTGFRKVVSKYYQKCLTFIESLSRIGDPP